MITIDNISINCITSRVTFYGQVATQSVLGETLSPFTVQLSEGSPHLDKEAWGNDDAIAAIADHFGISIESVTIQVAPDVPAPPLVDPTAVPPVEPTEPDAPVEGP